MPSKILTTGTAICIKEPRGECGLEGYNKGDTYKFELCDKDKHGKKYVRVFLPNYGNGRAYETCGPGEFKKFFEEI